MESGRRWRRRVWVGALALMVAGLMALFNAPGSVEAQASCPPGADPNSPGCRRGQPPLPGNPPPVLGPSQIANPCLPPSAHLINRPGTLNVSGAGAGALITASDSSGLGSTFTGPMTYAFQGAVLGPNTGAPNTNGPGNLRAQMNFTFTRPAGVVRFTSTCALEVDTFFQPTGDRGAVFIMTQGTITGLDAYTGTATCFMHLFNTTSVFVPSGKELDFGCLAGNFCSSGAVIFDSRSAVSPVVTGALNQFIGRMTSAAACAN